MEASLFGPSFWFGLAAFGAWGSFDFHNPLSVSELRYSTSRKRYWLGRVFYISACIFLYIIVVLGFIVFLKIINPTLVRVDIGDAARITNGWIPPALALLSLVGALYIPVFQNMVRTVRVVAQNVSLFPYEINGLITAICRAPFRESEDAATRVLKELSRYGADSTAIRSLIAPPAMRSLIELYTVRKYVERTTQIKAFRRYYEISEGGLGELDDQYRALLRRVGGLVSLGERGSETNDQRIVESINRISLIISELASETVMKLLMRYRRIIAQLTLICSDDVKRRDSFLATCGYNDIKTKNLPFWSLATLLVVYLTLFVVLMFAIRIGLINIPNAPEVRSYNLLVTATGTAGSQMLAIMWALIPKVVTPHFARPTYNKLPYNSYVIFGFCSYATSVAVSLLVTAGSSDLPLDEIALGPALIFSIMNAVTTVGASFLIDQRLKSGVYDYKTQLKQDAVVLAVTLALVNVVVQLLAILAGVGHTTIFIILWLIVGYIVGYTLPSSAAAQLTALEADIEKDVLEGTLAREISQRASNVSVRRARERTR
jgi:hypothetical protein